MSTFCTLGVKIGNVYRDDRYTKAVLAEILLIKVCTWLQLAIEEIPGYMPGGMDWT